MDNRKTVINVTMLGIILLLTSSIVRTGASLYLPALPVIGEDLAIPDATMSLTITVYFAAFSLFVFLTGPFSDAFGRRRLILTGVSVFILGSLICGLADSASYLIAGRICQAIGASMIPGTARAMIRDAGNDTQVISLMGWMAILGGLMMIAAPIMGGIITEHLTWRYNFYFLVIFSIFVLGVIIVKLPETLPFEKRIKLHPSETLKTYANIIISPSFSLVIMPIVICYAVQGAYLAAAPFIFIKNFQLTPTQFGLTNICIVIALLGGRHLSIHATKKYSPSAAYLLGASIVFASSLVFAIIAIYHIYNIQTLLLGISIFGLGFGVVSPIGMKSSITTFRKTSGMAASLQGCFAIGGTALGSAGVAFIMKTIPNAHPLHALSILVVVLISISLTSAIFARKMII